MRNSKEAEGYRSTGASRQRSKQTSVQREELIDQREAPRVDRLEIGSVRSVESVGDVRISMRAIPPFQREIASSTVERHDRNWPRVGEGSRAFVSARSSVLLSCPWTRWTIRFTVPSSEPSSPCSSRPSPSHRPVSRVHGSLLGVPPLLRPVDTTELGCRCCCRGCF